MARAIDADELEMFPYSEGAGTEEQISEWIEQAGLSEVDTADRARLLCWKVIEGYINVVKTQPTLTPPNEPLTLEQLREMDGEPVYIIASDMGIAEWNVIAGKVWITVAYDVPQNGFKTVVEGIRFINGRAFRFDSYGTSWFAYHRPPEGDTDA